jgi:transposase
MLQSVYDDEALSRRIVSEWFKRFKDGRENFEDDPSSGRPSTSRNADTISNAREIVIRDRRWALRMMAYELNIDMEMTRRILHEDLRKRKICAKYALRSLTHEQKQRRLTLCQDFIQTSQDNPNLLDSIFSYLR